MHKRAESSISLDLACGKVENCLVKIVLETSSTSGVRVMIKRGTGPTDRSPEIVDHKGSPIDGARILACPLRSQVRGELHLLGLQEGYDLEVAVNVVWPASADKSRGLDDLLGREWTERVWFGQRAIRLDYRRLAVHLYNSLGDES
jgi:hypothetical protein